MAQIARAIIGDKAVYDFVCDGCGVEGELGVPTNKHDTLGCPDNCGATYIQWQHLGKFTLTCVVCPVFERDEDQPAEEIEAEADAEQTANERNSCTTEEIRAEMEIM